MTHLDPTLVRYAKQVYISLNMNRRISLLSDTSVKLPSEVVKMQQVMLLLNKERLESIVKQFLNNKNKNRTLNDFIILLDRELEIFSVEEDPVDEFDEFDTFDDIDLSQIIQPVKKRERSPVDDNLSKMKKPRPNKPPAVSCFSVEIKDTETYNIICSPGGNSKIFNKVPWIILYEIARFIQAFNIKWTELPFDAFQMFLTVASKDYNKLYDTMVKWNEETRLDRKVNASAFTRMERCPESVWMHIKKTQPITGFLEAVEPAEFIPTSVSSSKKNAINQRMIHYSGVFHATDSNTAPVISLRAPKVEASNRLFRKFGQDRFFELKLAPFTSSSFVKAYSHYFLKPFLFMQRTYKFLFIKDDTIILFATEGDNLKPISIQQVIDWHMPITENWAMTMNKYASRMSLGYSSSIPTLKFKPEEIIYIDDEYADNAREGDETACMTDGCGIISCSAMQQIMGCQATDVLPCAVQGRIGGAKGIWIISPDLDFTTGNYIKIRKSQNKFKTGIAQPDLSLDPHHYTFDLVKNSVCVYPSNLNTQFIQALSAGGVPTSVFVEILKEYIYRLAAIVTENQNIKLLRDWVAKTGNIMYGRWESEYSTEKGIWRDLSTKFATEGDDEADSGVFSMDSNKDNNRENTPEPSSAPQPQIQESSNFFKMNKYSGQPHNLHELIVRLLDAGYDLSNPYLASRVTMVFRQIMQSITIKYRIEVPKSCTLTCVPDPTGTLKAGEVFLQLSSNLKDEKTGIRVGQILGDVIVTRNPCGLKSDVQKVKAVHSPALKMYTDIIVFSVKGETSLASQLSGGDYDGDMVFCCWDERIVEPFKSSPVISPPSRVDQAFDKDISTVGKEVGYGDDPERALQRNFISVALPDGTLGTYENWRTVLAEKVGMDDPDVRYLAHMCAKLVDAPKQGLRLKGTIRDEDKLTYADVPRPAWFVDKRNLQLKRPKNYDLSDEASALSVNRTTMDFLYDTLLKETAAFTKYSRTMLDYPEAPLKDPDLTEPWLRALELAGQMKDETLQSDLEKIKQCIQQNHRDYKSHCARFSQRIRQSGRPQEHEEEEEEDLDVTRFNSQFELEEYFARDFLTNPNTNDIQSSVMMFDIQVNGGRLLQNIKASYAYILSVGDNKYSKYCYVVAFDALRRIKADATAKKQKDNGLAESVAVGTYKCMSIDKRWIRKLKEANYQVDKLVEEKK